MYVWIHIILCIFLYILFCVFFDTYYFVYFFIHIILCIFRYILFCVFFDTYYFVYFSIHIILCIFRYILFCVFFDTYYFVYFSSIMHTLFLICKTLFYLKINNNKQKLCKNPIKKNKMRNSTIILVIQFGDLISY